MKRILAGLLLAVILFTCTACPATTGPAGPGTGNTGATFIDNIPEEYDGYFEGQTFYVSVHDYYTYEIYAEEDSTETVDQLVYKRNAALEARFGCKIEAVPCNALGQNDLDTHYTVVRDAITRNQNDFDAVMMMAWKNGPLVLDSMYLDWRDESLFPNTAASIKAHSEWWPEHINTNSTIAGHQYMAISDLCLTAMENSYAVLFNKDLEKEYNVAKTQFGKETLYEAVDTNAWTLDAFYEIVKDFYIPSTTTGAEDTYGLVVGGSTDVDAWAYALGFNYIINDGENYPYLWSVSDKIANAIFDLRDLYDCDSVHKLENVFNDRTPFFVDGHALFNLSPLELLKSATFHDMESDYGILPYPKLDGNQKEYLTGSMDHFSCISVPWLVALDEEKLKLIDVMIEALSAESCDDVKDAYYESVMKYNSTRDEDSVRMIDKIMNGRVYDLAIYHYAELNTMQTKALEGAFGLFFRRMLSNEINSDPANFWNQKERNAIELQLTTLIERYQGVML